MRIAIIGAGISGLAAAHKLHGVHDVTLFEAAEHAGGHAQTVDVEIDGRTLPVDLGFVVFNYATYPHFSSLLNELGVASRPTGMSFSVRCEQTGLEYCGTSLDTLFAQRRNLFRPSFIYMVANIMRFNREAKAAIESGVQLPSLRDFLAERGYGQAFVRNYIVPMGSAIWSAGRAQLLDFPAEFFLRFFDNHGLLSATQQHRWRTVRGGSRRYVQKLTDPFRDRIFLRTPVLSIRRDPAGASLRLRDDWCRFDEVVIATHADRALRMLEDPSTRERDLLGSFAYQKNSVVLHTDENLLPRSRRARACWNYHIPATDSARAVVTYDMSQLQGLDTLRPVCVTLNRADEIDPSCVIFRAEMSHPVFTLESIRAQQRHAEISGVNKTHYCGAYWGNGFHEDGMRSAIAVCAALSRREAA